MRPLLLRLQGLRSYRQLQEVDFRGKGLVAIVGNTGAGKSSLLEAMVYALYNASTWNKQSAAALISDGEKSMAVTFDFEVSGVQWRVERATCRDNYPPSQHKLVCLTDPARPALTQEGTVNDEIERLVGLKYEAFKSAILLPQGQFQALVTAKGTVRTGILKAILALDVLVDGLLGATAEASARLVPQLAAREGERARLLPEPALVAREASDRKDTARRRADELGTAVERYRATSREAEGAASESAALSQRRLRLVDALKDDAKTLTQLVSVLAGIEERRSHQRAEERDASEQVERLGATLGEAEKQGESLAHLSAAAVALEGLISAGPELAAERQRLESESKAIEEEERDIQGTAAKAPELAAALGKQERHLREASEAVSAAMTRHTEAKNALASARRTRREGKDAAAAVEKARDALRIQEGEVKTALRLDADAAKQHKQAEAAYKAALRSHAASHAAQGLGPGDPCPICAKPLDPTYQPPRDESDDAALAQTNAQDAALRAKAAVAAAEERRRSLQTSVQEKELGAGARQQEAADALTSLEALVDSVDLDSDDSTLLRPLVEHGQKVRAVETQAKATRDAAKRDVDALDAALVPRRKTLRDRQERLAGDQKALKGREQGTEAQRTSLPAAFRPELGAATSEIKALLERLQARLTSLREIGRDHSSAAKRCEEARRALTQLDRDQKAEVDTPQQLAAQRLAVLADRMAEGGGASKVATPLPGTPLADQAAWATTLENRVRQEVGDLDRQNAAATDTASKAKAAQLAILVNAGFRDVGTLEKALTSATGEAEAAAAEEEKALAQVPIADDLDRRLGPARELRDALSELARLLSDGKFVGFVVERRQRTLLVVASEILKSMTRQRYAFAENFRIVDLNTSQARSVETLSGGEQFLASLSLALGLVELAGRSGGRVDSLILDEGFASLDTSVLGCALDELACRAGTGKLVALVSHLGAVADAAPEVLYILQKDGSSVARWRTEARDDPELDAIDGRLHRE